MTQAEFGSYLVFASGVCLVLAILNAIRARYFLAGACLSVAAAMISYRNNYGEAAVTFAAIVAGAFLMLDLASRLRKQPGEAPRK